LRAIATALEVTPSELMARAEQLSVAARSRAEGSTHDRGDEGTRVSTAGRTRADDADLAALVRDIVRDELTAARAEPGDAAGSRAPRRGSPEPPSASAPAAAKAGASAGVAISSAALREGVLAAMRQMLDNPDIDFDSEGDIPIRRNDVMLFVRVLDEPSSVLVFSPMIVGIDESAALLERINDLNANVHFVRFCLTHGGVVADIELFAEPFDPALVTAACRTLTQTAEVVGPDLQEEYGGRLFFGDEHEPKPRPGTGGYL